MSLQIFYTHTTTALPGLSEITDDKGKVLYKAKMWRVVVTFSNMPKVPNFVFLHTKRPPTTDEIRKATDNFIASALEFAASVPGVVSEYLDAYDYLHKTEQRPDDQTPRMKKALKALREIVGK